MVKLLLPCGRGSLGLAVLFSLCAEFVSVSFFGHIPNYITLTFVSFVVYVHLPPMNAQNSWLNPFNVLF